jgi:hypothetical protein
MVRPALARQLSLQLAHLLVLVAFIIYRIDFPSGVGSSMHISSVFRWPLFIPLPYGRGFQAAFWVKQILFRIWRPFHPLPDFVGTARIARRLRDACLRRPMS